MRLSLCIRRKPRLLVPGCGVEGAELWESGLRDIYIYIYIYTYIYLFVSFFISLFVSFFICFCIYALGSRAPTHPRPLPMVSPPPPGPRPAPALPAVPPERTHANQREGGRWKMIPASASSQERRTASEQGQGHRLQGEKSNIIFYGNEHVAMTLLQTSGTRPDGESNKAKQDDYPLDRHRGIPWGGGREGECSSPASYIYIYLFVAIYLYVCTCTYVYIYICIHIYVYTLHYTYT